MRGEVLYEEVCKVESLFSAWTKVKEKHSIGDIDKVTMECFEANFESNLQELSRELSLGCYMCEPHYEFEIPKDHGDNTLCSFNLSILRDEIVQQAVKDGRATI